MFSVDSWQGGEQLSLPTFVEEVLTPVDHFGVDPTKLKLEITESLPLSNVDDIIAMAQCLSLNVIAEGVETIAQRQLLLDRGCTTFQGYLLGRPVPIEQFDASLAIPSNGYSVSGKTDKA